MTTFNNSTASEIALNADGGAPEWIELIPAGRDVVGFDGRSWIMEDADGVVTAFNSRGRPVPLDWEHATQIRASRGEEAPAAGWIERLANRSGAIWGKMSWTDKGRESVASRAYRFVSPAFDFDPASRVIKALVHAGLTNQPNLRLAALNRTDPEEDTPPMTTKPITDALGLVDGASADQCVTAINALKVDRQTALNRAEKPDPEKYVPKGDYDLALNKLGTFEDAEKTRAEAEIVAAVDAVIAVGDPACPPANRDDYLAMCRQEGGLERFKKLFKPQVDRALNRTETAGKTVPGTTASTRLTGDERIACNQLGMTEEAYLEAKKEDA